MKFADTSVTIESIQSDATCCLICLIALLILIIGSVIILHVVQKYCGKVLNIEDAIKVDAEGKVINETSRDFK